MPDKLISVGPKYRLYIDESGDHTFNLLEDPSRRYLCLLGVWFKLRGEYERFAEDLEKFKKTIFGFRPDKPVVLHRSEIVNRKGAFGRLRDPGVEQAFNEGLLEIIRDAKFQMIRVIIDKKRYLDEYEFPYHPYLFCMAAMLERYCGWLKLKNSMGDVLAESRGKEEDHQLQRAYNQFYESGTMGQFGRRHHQSVLSSNKLKIKWKVANIAGLQLADVLAHPIKQAGLIEKGLAPDSGMVFGKRIYEVAVEKFFRNDHGQVEGYGKVFLPRN